MRFVSSKMSYNFCILTNIYDVLPSQIDKNQFLHLIKAIFLINLSYIFDEILKLYDISKKTGPYAAKTSYILKKIDNLYDISSITSPKQSAEPSHSHPSQLPQS